MNPIIISLAINGGGRGDDYEKNQKGLVSTIPPYTDSWILNSYHEGVTPHTEVPYLFKFDLIQQAINLGYTEIMWADSTMRVLKDPFPLLRKEKTGIIAFDNSGHPAWKYTSNRAAENLKKYYKNIFEVKQTWGGCFLLDISKPLPKKILKEIVDQASKGSFDNDLSERVGL